MVEEEDGDQEEEGGAPVVKAVVSPLQWTACVAVYLRSLMRSTVAVPLRRSGTRIGDGQLPADDAAAAGAN